MSDPRSKVWIHVVDEGRALCSIEGIPGHWPSGNISVHLSDVPSTARACVDPDHELHAIYRHEMCPNCMETQIAPDADVIRMFTICFNPTDYPRQYVVRQSFVTPLHLPAVSVALAPLGTTPSAGELPNMRTDRLCMVASTLEKARLLVPPGLECVARNESDPIPVVEVWM